MLQQQKVYKKCMTLIEIMIVMTLISVIGSIVLFNIRGGLDKGKEFKTINTIQRIEQILIMEMIEHDRSYDEIEENWETIVKNSPFFKDEPPASLCKDAWGNNLELSIEEERLNITSPHLNK